ncbi:hypothetical protein KY334_05300, partial [Candidatus Woesearchaeota archaeon]|nr:hypothetical protein [Candidatus Woesearchaeota archaeon]
KYPGIKNYNVVVDESGGKITFLHKIVEGGTDKSYGIEVAKLAGIPEEVVSASKKVMREIEKEVEMNQKVEIKKDLVSLKDFI